VATPEEPPAALQKVSAVVKGLEGKVVLQSGNGEDLVIEADGTFVFPTSVSVGGAYDVKVRDQPYWQNCSILDGQGLVNADGALVNVMCAEAKASVSTFSGSGANTSVDGSSSTASFFVPVGIAVGQDGGLFVSEQSGKIRRVAVNGDVVTFAGNTSGNYTDGNGTSASFGNLIGIAIDSSGQLFAADAGWPTIRIITPAADVSTFAGSAASGSADGNGTAAEFLTPVAVAVDATSNVYVADFQGCVVRKISPTRDVITLAGTSGTCGFADGSGGAALLNHPFGIAVNAAGDIFLADTANNRIRRITPAGVTTTFAGSGVAGSTDGDADVASFNAPAGLAFDARGNLYVADVSNNVIRKITPAGKVSTVAGSAGMQGATNGVGAAATFNHPFALAIAADGAIYVAENGNSLIRKISPFQDP